MAIVVVLLVYLVPGLLVGTGFIVCGVSRVDPVAAGSPVVFRLLILPGCVALWPVMLVKWCRAMKEGAR